MRRSTPKTTRKQREEYYRLYAFPWLNGLLKELDDAERRIRYLENKAKKRK